jgi:sialic acid synthase SpsE
MGKKTIRIADRLVGDGQPCYVIAEAGVNHNGRLDLARELIDIAAEAQAEAVKFQKRTPRDILIQEALEREYPSSTALGATYGEHREKLELSADEYRELAKLAEERGITLLASVWDPGSADFVDELDTPAVKIPSADVTNLPLIEHVAENGKPMLISTGMSDLDEIADAVATVRRYHDDIVLLQCTSTYPADNNELNLRAMETLRRTFDCLVGYSGHERGLAPSEAAVALGACVLERHFTIDRAMPGPDHPASLEPGGLRRLVRDIRNIESAMGSPEKALLESEAPNRERLAKSVVAACDISAGTRIALSMLAVKGPGNGISPRFLPRLEGVVAQTDIKSDTLIPIEALEWR